MSGKSEYQVALTPLIPTFQADILEMELYASCTPARYLGEIVTNQQSFLNESTMFVLCLHTVLKCSSASLYVRTDPGAE
jgi:hypothetical protein